MALAAPALAQRPLDALGQEGRPANGKDLIDKISPLRGRLPPDEDSPDRPPLAVDRQTVRQLESAVELVGKKDFLEAARQFQHVLDNPEDSWVEITSGKGSKFTSARQIADERLGHLPKAAREAYETEYGPTAQRMLEDAAVRGDRTALEDVVRRYFYTRAGAKAAYLLASRLLDDSLPLAAAIEFDRLRKSSGGAQFEPMLSLKTACCWALAGAPKKTMPILIELKQRSPDKEIKIGGRTIPLFENDEDALPWLARCMGASTIASQSVEKTDQSSRERPSDAAQAGAGSPAERVVDPLPEGKPVWSDSLVTDRDLKIKDRFPVIESALKEYEAFLNDRGILTIPAGRPLVVGRTVVFRTLARLRAVDLTTGEPLWDFAEPDRLYRILAAENYGGHFGHRLPISMESQEQDEVRLFLNSRLFRDMTYAGISTDGQHIFAILQPGFLGLDEPKPTPQGEILSARSENVLAAVDVASGRLLWEIGGVRNDHGREHAGTFFLGCGTPLGSHLYALGELDGEITLFQLDSETGKTEWSQRLVTPLGRLPHFPLRRLAGGNPGFGQGILVCPTTAGVIVGFDPFGRTLLWDYRYHINVAEGFPDPRVEWVDQPLFTKEDETTRWLDSSPIISAGSVIVTPRDSDDLHCLNLTDGTLRWKRPRGRGLFVATVFDNTVFIVGSTGIEALRQSDGEPLWKRPIDLPAPAGFGLRAGHLYHLPLSTGELATIDLGRGRVITRSKFPEGLQPGNLVAGDGSVVMQSTANVRGFRPTAEWDHEIARALKQNPDDAAALSQRGELRLHRAESENGLKDLLKSLGLRPDGRTQSLAVATLLESLRFDFEGSRAAATQIEPLLADPEQRFEFHRLMADGLLKSGDRVAAFGHELLLAQDRDLANILIPIGESLRVRASQVVAPELRELYHKASSAEKAQLQKPIDEWVAKLSSREDIEQQKLAATALGQIPEGIALRRALVEKLAAPAQRAERVRQLMRLRHSGGEAGGAATAMLARLMIDHHRAADALNLLSALAEKYGDVACAGAKTGRELAAAWSDEAAVKTARSRKGPWPSTDLAVKRVEENHPVQSVFPLPLEQRTGSLFRNWRFEWQHLTDQGFSLVGIDETGNRRWQLDLTGDKFGEPATRDQPIAIRTNGSLIELVMRQRFAILDGFDPSKPPRVLWSRELHDPNLSPVAQLRSEPALTGLLTDDFVCYQLGPGLCCADSITGDVLWERRNIPFTYVLHGDEDDVIALNREPNDPYVAVLRATTGSQTFTGPLGFPGLFSGEWRGRRALTTSVQPPKLSLSMIDVAEGKPAWTKSYALPTSPPLFDEGEVAVVDSDVVLHVSSFDSGKDVFTKPIEGGGRAGQISIRRVGSRYLLLSQGSQTHLGPPTREALREAAIGRLSIVDRDTGKIVRSDPLPLPQALIDVPEGSPAIVLVRRPTRLEALRSNGAEAVITILDARTARTIYEGQENSAGERVSVRLDADAHKVIITMDRSRLEITPAHP